MHFWVFCEWLNAAECLVSGLTGNSLQHSITRKRNPILLADSAVDGIGSYTLRSRSAVLCSTVVAALARSHGSRANSRLTSVFGDGALTVDSSLIGTYLGRRGHGALTEHHVLCGLADIVHSACSDGEEGYLPTFGDEWGRWALRPPAAVREPVKDTVSPGNNGKQTVVVVATNDGDCCNAKKDEHCDSSGQDSSTVVHILLGLDTEAVARERITAAAAATSTSASTAVDTSNFFTCDRLEGLSIVRAIVAAHNLNDNALWRFSPLV